MLRHKKTPLNHGGIFLGCVFLEILRSRQWRSRYGARGALQIWERSNLHLLREFVIHCTDLIHYRNTMPNLPPLSASVAPASVAPAFECEIVYWALLRAAFSFLGNIKHTQQE